MKRRWLFVFSLFLMAAVVTWVALHLPGFNPLEILIQKKRPVTPIEREAAKAVDYRYYLGKWISGEDPHEELLAEKGGWLLDIKDIQAGELKGSCHAIAGSPGHEVAAIEFHSKLTGNQTQFNFTDSLFNKGHAKLRLNGERITLVLDTKLSPENHTGWSINGQGPLINRKVGFQKRRLQANTEMLRNILGYLDLKKDELLRQLGGKYRVVPNEDEYYETFMYQDLDIAAAISYNYDVLWITCGPKVDINGVRAGMNFAAIMEKMGTALISRTFKESPSRPLYEISYPIGACRVLFQSPFKDGRDSETIILKEPFHPKAGFSYTLLKPVDQGKNDPEFLEFRNQLLAALKRKDAPFLLEQVDGNIQFRSGAAGDKAGFISEWGLDQAPDKSAIWNELAGVLRLGGVFHEPGNFTAPYTFAKFPGSFDGCRFAVAIRPDANVYYRPSPTSAVIAKLNYEIVSDGDFYMLRSRGSHFKEWRAVTTSFGLRGFVRKRYLRGPMDYRASFRKIDGRWRMVGFIRGG
jgi:hypothetical protein